MFKNRGIDPAEVGHYLSPTEQDTYNPLYLTNVKEGAKLLAKHIGQGSKTMIIVDSDCDGFSSAAVLINYLNRLFPHYVQNNIFYRPHGKKHHGIVIEDIPKDIDLLIVPDASSNEYDIHKTLFDKGIDILILDHHKAEKVSEYACVINNQLCDYPTKSLSGVGIVYKFCKYFDEIMGVNYADDFLDLVSVGMIADVMDLRDFETHYFIEQGIDNVINPFLKGLKVKQDHSLKQSGGYTPFGISFYIAPMINAVARMGTYEEQVLMFEAMLEFRAYDIIDSTKRGCKGQTETKVEQACRNCTNIKNRQTKARDNSLEIIEKLIQEQNLLENKIIIIKLDNDIKADENITGLIANQIMDKYKRPTLILNKTIEDKKIVWKGSGRGPGEDGLEDFRRFLENSGYFKLAQGHENAFGVAIDDEQLESFIKYSNEVLEGVDFTTNYKVDFVYDMKEIINQDDIIDISKMKRIWGKGIEEPLVVIKNLEITEDNIRLMGTRNSVLRIDLPSPNGGISVVNLRSSEEEFNDLCLPSGCVTINVVGTCSQNEYDNNPQIKLKEYEVVRKYYRF